MAKEHFISLSSKQVVTEWNISINKCYVGFHPSCMTSHMLQHNTFHTVKSFSAQAMSVMCPTNFCINWWYTLQRSMNKWMGTTQIQIFALHLQLQPTTIHDIRQSLYPGTTQWDLFWRNISDIIWGIEQLTVQRETPYLSRLFNMHADILRK